MRVPKTLAAATTLIERFAVVDAELEQIEAVRNAAIVAANQVADQAGADLVKELGELTTALSAWWPSAAPALTLGKRKSIELAGYNIGSKSGRASLAVEGDEDGVIAALGKLRWAKPLLRTKVSLDKAAILKALSGARGEDLGKLGLKRDDGAETFLIERVAQTGTLAGTKA